MSGPFEIQQLDGCWLLRLLSSDGTNRLTRECVLGLTAAVQELRQRPAPLIVAGNSKFFSAGAELREIAALTAAEAYEFSRMGQELMNSIEQFPACVYAAIEGYCLGGGLDLALACHRRMASPQALFGHRGAALGLITGWGGTQRLPRLIGKAKALEMFAAAEKIHAAEALRIGLIDAVDANPIGAALQHLGGGAANQKVEAQL